MLLIKLISDLMRSLTRALSSSPTSPQPSRSVGSSITLEVVEEEVVVVVVELVVVVVVVVELVVLVVLTYS